MDVYTRMSNADASDYETEETPDQFVIRLKNYLAKWLELSGSSPQNFDALVDLIVKEQFITPVLKILLCTC